MNKFLRFEELTYSASVLSLTMILNKSCALFHPGIRRICMSSQRSQSNTIILMSRSHVPLRRGDMQGKTPNLFCIFFLGCSLLNIIMHLHLAFWNNWQKRCISGGWRILLTNRQLSFLSLYLYSNHMFWFRFKENLHVSFFSFFFHGILAQFLLFPNG
jgi:hypothetical protein